jgi:hypothetical protein
MDVPPFPELDDSTFRKTHAGPYHFHASGFWAVENFIDASHFPFVHGAPGDHRRDVGSSNAREGEPVKTYDVPRGVRARQVRCAEVMPGCGAVVDGRDSATPPFELVTRATRPSATPRRLPTPSNDSE